MVKSLQKSGISKSPTKNGRSKIYLEIIIIEFVHNFTSVYTSNIQEAKDM